MHLSNLSAVVTGGASGLGLATARQLAARGVMVVIADLNEALGAAAVAELRGQARYVHAEIGRAHV